MAHVLAVPIHGSASGLGASARPRWELVLVTLHPVSLAIGFVLALVWSGVGLAAFAAWKEWQARKARDEAVDRVIAKVAVASLNMPPDLRVMK